LGVSRVGAPGWFSPFGSSSFGRWLITRPRAIMGPLPQYMGSPHFFSHLKTTKIWVKIWVGPWGVRWAISGSVSSRKLELVDPTARFTEYFAF
jgi:hypothetical protein